MFEYSGDEEINMFTQTEIFPFLYAGFLIGLCVFIIIAMLSPLFHRERKNNLSKKELAEYKKYLQGPLDPRD
jgi:hypothetical protein